MRLAELKEPSVLILGLGVEGRSTLRYLRAAYPAKTLGVADRLPLEKLAPETKQFIERDSRIRLHFGDGYLGSLAGFDVIVKSPGIPVTCSAYRRALAAGKQFTSHTALFLANFSGMVIGVTGTKGKSTTASLLHSILKTEFPDAQLVGNIGVPPLDLLPPLAAKREQETRNSTAESENPWEDSNRIERTLSSLGPLASSPPRPTGPIVVYELSSHQLVGLRQSPHIAVLLNIVPEHLDYYESFEQYVAAKENITRFQTARDFLVYDFDHDLPRQIAARSKAQGVACSLVQAGRHVPTCFLFEDRIIYRSESAEEDVVSVRDIRLPGKFNLINVAAAVAAGKLAGVPAPQIGQAIRNFQPLEHRLECAGAYGGVTYYNDSIATVPEATIAALDTLGNDVETVLLGGMDRGLDFSALAKRLLGSDVRTVVLFPPSGVRIWKAISEQASTTSSLPRHFFANTMEEAARIAQAQTTKGKICLLSPASPSFGLFRDYRERGEAFKRLVREGDVVRGEKG